MQMSSLVSAVILAIVLQDEGADRARAAFLADTAGPAALRGLASFPELLDDRQVRQKILRSFSSSDPAISAAALELTMKTPRLAADPNVIRSLDLAVSGRDVQKKIAFLEMAVQQDYLSDVRIVTVISEALSDPAPALRVKALEIVRDHERLRRMPAVADALDRLPERLERPVVKLPDLESFKEMVQPVLETPGPDNAGCSSCHQTHAVLKLLPMDGGTPAEDQIKARYRAALRVIDPADPESSLILRKPTSPYLPQGAADGSLTHGGGVRFEKGSASYRAILDWIKTARP